MGTGFKWSQPYQTIKAGDFVLWKWSSPDLVTGLNFKIEQVDDPGSTNPVANGFNSGDATPSGIKNLNFQLSFCILLILLQIRLILVSI